MVDPTSVKGILNCGLGVGTVDHIFAKRKTGNPVMVTSHRDKKPLHKKLFFMCPKITTSQQFGCCPARRWQIKKATKSIGLALCLAKILWNHFIALHIAVTHTPIIQTWFLPFSLYKGPSRNDVIFYRGGWGAYLSTLRKLDSNATIQCFYN